MRYYKIILLFSSLLLVFEFEQISIIKHYTNNSYLQSFTIRELNYL